MKEVYHVFQTTRSQYGMSSSFELHGIPDTRYETPQSVRPFDTEYEAIEWMAQYHPGTAFLIIKGYVMR